MFILFQPIKSGVRNVFTGTILTNSEESQRKENKNVHYTTPMENN